MLQILGDLFQVAKVLEILCSEKIVCVFKIVQHLEKVFADATVDCDTVFIKKSDMEPKEVNLIIQDREVEVMNHQIDRSVFKKARFL